MDKNDKLISEHIREKDESKRFKERRFEQWNENYFLYRDKVTTNRLTQRQAINIPIMRDTIQTWISKIDEPPELNFKARGRTNKDMNAEIIMDEMWGYYFDRLKLDIMDNLDKKIVGLQGRSFKICGMSAGEFFMDVIDPYDIEISPRVNPLDLNSAQYVIRTNIFKPLREVLANKKYDEEEKQKLKMYLDSKEGLISSAGSESAYIEKMQRLRDLGANNYDDYNASEVLVEINESYKMIWNVEQNRFVRHLIVIAADKAVLYDKPIKTALGLSRLPIISWADDSDLNDVWCDGKGDAVRTINKVVNMYISQDVENRAYRNFGMHFYNTLNGTFQPRAFDPRPFGFYGMPGNPNELMKSVDIPALNDTQQQITFLKDMIQSTVAQTPTERGIAAGSRTTLGEVQINLQQSTGRNTVTAKNYRRAWEECGEIFYELMSNNSRGAVTLYKKGSNGSLYEKTIYPTEWILPKGYKCQVVMKSENDALDQFSIQKAQYIIANFQDNPIAMKLAKKKQLEIMGWTTEEIEQAMAFEDQKGAAPMPGQDPAQSGGAPAPSAQGGMFNSSSMLNKQTT